MAGPPRPATTDPLTGTANLWGRRGGEEFAIVLVETAPPRAAIVAERIRAWFAAITPRCAGHDIEFTVGIGCTALNKTVAGLEEVLRTAHQLMYQAKQSGRNRVVLDARGRSLNRVQDARIVSGGRWEAATDRAPARSSDNWFR
jgi:predicted signal transduction protein with EAL and GGDEF domain